SAVLPRKVSIFRTTVHNASCTTSPAACPSPSTASTCISLPRVVGGNVVFICREGNWAKWDVLPDVGRVAIHPTWFGSLLFSVNDPRAGGTVSVHRRHDPASATSIEPATELSACMRQGSRRGR